MSAELLFSIANNFILIPWLLLALLPRWEWTHKLIFHAWIPILIAVAYVFALVQGFGTTEDGGFNTLQSVMAFFTNPWAVTAGWLHYLAFDLFVGAWEVRDAQRRAVHHLLVVPCLFFTLMLGPVGLALYFIVRAITGKGLSTIETSGVKA